MGSIEERERKFLVSDASFLEGHTPTQIRQKYLFIGEATEVRLRRVDSRFTIAGKTEPFLSRTEEERDVEDSDLWQAILDDGDDNLIVKDRYSLVHTEDSIWEVDVFHAANSGLVLAEIELQSAESSIRIPEWCGTEVTGVHAFYNRELARSPISSWSTDEISKYELTPNSGGSI